MDSSSTPRGCEITGEDVDACLAHAAGTVDLIYASTSMNVTTGPEMPVATGVLNDLELTGDEGMTFGADVTVNGTCSATGSNIYTDAYTLTLDPAATLVESDSITVVGTAMKTVSPPSPPATGSVRTRNRVDPSRESTVRYARSEPRS